MSENTWFEEEVLQLSFVLVLQDRPRIRTHPFWPTDRSWDAVFLAHRVRQCLSFFHRAGWGLFVRDPEHVLLCRRRIQGPIT